MADPVSGEQEPPSDLFVSDGEDECWAWVGNHTAEQAISFARRDHGIEGPIQILRIRARIDRGPDDQSPDGEWLVPDPAGPFEFWQVQGEGSHA